MSNVLKIWRQNLQKNFMDMLYIVELDSSYSHLELYNQADQFQKFVSNTDEGIDKINRGKIKAMIFGE